MPQLLNHLVAVGEGGARGELADRRLKGFRHDRTMVLGRRELGAAIGTESRRVGVVGMTGRAFDGQAGFPFLAWPQINGGMDGKSNGECLRGFEPPTFGSGDIQAIWFREARWISLLLQACFLEQGGKTRVVADVVQQKIDFHIHQPAVMLFVAFFQPLET